MRAVSPTVVAVGVLVLVLAAPRPAAAAAGDLPPETGLGAGQLLIGAATASLALAIPVFADGTPLETAAYVTLLAGPAAVGGMVCTFGQTSKHYTGGCGPSVVGAYIGAMAGLPLLLITSASDDSGGKNYASGDFIGFMIGYAIGTAVGATAAWHWRKQERGLWLRQDVPPPEASLDARPWPELRWRPAPGARAAIGRVVPLVAFSF